MAPGCPNLGFEGAKMTVIWGGPAAYDGLLGPSWGHLEAFGPNAWEKWASCVDVARFLTSGKFA